MARMNISVPDDLYERYKRSEERLNASRVCAEALERELDVLEGVGDGEAAVLAMVERLMGAKERSYGWGYADGRKWGLAYATRHALQTARELKGYSGRELLLDLRDPEASEENAQFNAGVPWADIPGLTDRVGLPGLGLYDRVMPIAGPGRRYEVECEVQRHEREDQKGQGDPEAYAEGWRDALADLYMMLLKAEQSRRTRTSVPHAFRKALEDE